MRKREGFSLFELVVAIAMTAVLIIFTAMAIIKGLRYASEQEKYTIALNIARDQFTYIRLLPKEKLIQKEPVPIYFADPNYKNMGFEGEIILEKWMADAAIAQATVTVKWLAGTQQPRDLKLSRLIRIDRNDKK